MMVRTIKRVALSVAAFKRATANDPDLDATRFVTKVLDVRPTGRDKALYFVLVGADLEPENQTVLPFVDKTDKFKRGDEVVLQLTKAFSVIVAEPARRPLKGPSPEELVAIHAAIRGATK